MVSREIRVIRENTKKKENRKREKEKKKQALFISFKKVKRTH